MFCPAMPRKRPVTASLPPAAPLCHDAANLQRAKSDRWEHHMMETTNPRFLPGSISGQAMTHDDNGRKVDTRYGIVVTGTDGCLIEHPVAGEITIAYAVGGVVDDTTDRVRALYHLPPAMVAPRVGELAGVLLRR